MEWREQLLRANEDVQTAVRNELSPPIVGANMIRLLPYSQHLRTVCLRFELYGCPYDGKFPLAQGARLIVYTRGRARGPGRKSGACSLAANTSTSASGAKWQIKSNQINSARPGS